MGESALRSFLLFTMKEVDKDDSYYDHQSYNHTFYFELYIERLRLPIFDLMKFSSNSIETFAEGTQVTPSLQQKFPWTKPRWSRRSERIYIFSILCKIGVIIVGENVKSSRDRTLSRRNSTEANILFSPQNSLKYY